MAKPKNQGKTWTSAQDRELRSLAKANTPTRVIGLRMGRSEDAIRSRASQKSVSLKPVNQPPYSRRRVSK